VAERSSTRAQSLLDRVLSATGLAPELNMATGPDGLVWIDDGDTRIAIAVPSRSKRYRHGINRRCRTLTDRYLGFGQVPIGAGDNVINVGANVGEVAKTLASRGATVIALECDANVLPCLDANTKGSTVTVLPVAAWKEGGPLTIFIATAHADTSAVNPSDETAVVEARTIDAVVDDAGLDRVHLIVGDAEGAEPEVLAGARNTLRRTSFVSMACGYERGAERTLEQCESILKESGFEIIRRNQRGNCILIGRRTSRPNGSLGPGRWS
jgi:FkbM family methyltransferase